MKLEAHAQQISGGILYDNYVIGYLVFAIRKIKNIINSSYFIPSVYGYEGIIG